MNISGLSDRSGEEWKGRRSEGGGEGGPGNQIWFCRSHKWLKACRFQSGRPVFISLPDLRPLLCISSLSSSSRWPDKKKNKSLLLSKSNTFAADKSTKFIKHWFAPKNWLKPGSWGTGVWIKWLYSRSFILPLNWSVRAEIGANRNSTGR